MATLSESGEGPRQASLRDWEAFPEALLSLRLGRRRSWPYREFVSTMSGKRSRSRSMSSMAARRAHYAMDALKRSMAWDKRAYGREYDLDIFNIVAVSDFNMGAMENKGLNVFNDKYVLASPETATDDDYANIEGVIAHEYFHNWTGNRVTCRDWFQLCLKEGLTVFRDQEFSADVAFAAVERIGRKSGCSSGQFPEDAGPLAHPVRRRCSLKSITSTRASVYQKGAELCGCSNRAREGRVPTGLRSLFRAAPMPPVEDSSRHWRRQATNLALACSGTISRPQSEARITYSQAAKSARLTLSQSYSGRARKESLFQSRCGLGCSAATAKNLPHSPGTAGHAPEEEGSLHIRRCQRHFGAVRSARPFRAR